MSLLFECKENVKVLFVSSKVDDLPNRNFPSSWRTGNEIWDFDVPNQLDLISITALPIFLLPS